MDYIPGQAHINKIREALWQGREYGHAAVLVGSGFSLNAKPIGMARQAMPMWGKLTQRLVDELYPIGSCPDSVREKAFEQTVSTSGALRLAEEYEAAFGRDALDKFLINELSDSAFEPGHLHKLLLSLPWADVFTTNYDTLLERAVIGLLDRKYSIINTMSEIPGTMKPRIVKLHGSFPSSRPFILTEEDFRTYTRNFAPFVNLAQQSMMENVFCLIGFSGDDPNFLYWTGWVRDNLGKHAPQIYLCGLLNLTPARIKLLQDRNVIPIDLSPLFPIDKWPSSAERHAKALEWLLLSLDAGRPQNPLVWPENEENLTTTQVPKDLPPLAKTPRELYADERVMGPESTSFKTSDDQKTQIDELIKQTKGWETNRKLYPGWLIAPPENRSFLWRHTENWIQTVLNLGPVMGFEERIKVLHELNWRLERCLIPLDNNLASLISSTLEGVNPFPHTLVDLQATYILSSENLSTYRWPVIREAWCDLCLAILKFYRERQAEEQFSKWANRLKLLENELPRLHSALKYEECLLAFGRMDHKSARKILDSWNLNDDDPFWLIRYAGVLAEIGDLSKAEEIADKGLSLIREKSYPSQYDFAMLSREGWAMILVRTIKMARSVLHNQIWPNFRGRWERLAEYKCNPHPDLDLLKIQLQKPAPGEPTAQTVRPGFNRGQMTKTLHLVSESQWSRLLPALQFVRLSEEAAYIPRIGIGRLGADELIRAAQWLQETLPERSINILLRTADQNAIQDFFTRHQIAMLSAVEVKALYSILSSALSNLLPRLSPQSLSTISGQFQGDLERTGVAIELLSRLALRLSSEELEIEFNRIVALYRSSPISKYYVLYDAFGNLLARILEAMPQDNIKRHLLDLIELPIPSFDGYAVSDPDRWIEPAMLLPNRLEGIGNIHRNEQWKEVFDFLLRAANSNDDEARYRGIFRLARLYHYELLNNTEITQFTKALWKRRDAESQLPEVRNFYKHTFLSLPELKPGITESLFKEFILKKPIPCFSKEVVENGVKKLQLFLGTGDIYLKEIIEGTLTCIKGQGSKNTKLISWSNEELEQILLKIISWWSYEGKQLSQKSEEVFISNEIQERLKNIVEILATIVIPGSKKGGTLNEKLSMLLTEMIETGIPVFPALYIMLIRDRENLKTVVDEFRKGLASQEEFVSSQAIHALYSWLACAQALEIPLPPRELINEIGYIISYRKTPSLLTAMQLAFWILIFKPSVVDDDFVKSILIGLQYLLDETRYNREAISFNLNQESLLEYRVWAVKLATALHKQKRTSASIIMEWINSAKNDPMPEVRNAANSGKL